MSALQTGDKVRHPKMPEWGIGKVMEVSREGKAKVFFIHAGEKLLGLKHVTLEKVEGDEAKNFILDSPTLGERLKDKDFRSLPQALADFRKYFPDGFEDKGYWREERNYKLEACKLFRETLATEHVSALLAEGNYDELVKRALQVVNKTNLIFPNEKMSLKDGLKTDRNKKHFAETLSVLLYGTGDLQPRFEAFTRCLEEIGAAKWTIATYFPFLANPEEHMFLKPMVTQHAANLIKAELSYRSNLNWLTYKGLLEFSRGLKMYLVDAGMPPYDMIDVQSFMWCIAPGNYDVPEGGAFAGTKEDYKRALRKLEAEGHLQNTKYAELLKAQYEAEKQTITATLLAEAAGYANYNAVNLQYGTLGKLLAGYLSYLPPKRANGERMWWRTLAEGNEASSETIDGRFEFVMRPELAAALEDLPWVKPKE